MNLKMPNNIVYPRIKSGMELYHIKGLKITTENTFIDILIQYFNKGESFFYFSSAFDGINDLITDLKSHFKGKIIVFSEEEAYKANYDYSEFDYLVFYNYNPPWDLIDYKRHHIGVFYDYVGINIDYKSYAQDFIQKVPQDVSFSVVCKEPRNKTIKFAFGTSEKAKPACIYNYNSKDYSIYVKENVERFNNIQNFIGRVITDNNIFKNRNILETSTVCDYPRYKKIVFYDINHVVFNHLLPFVDDFVFIYTKDDLNELKLIVSILYKLNFDVPEYIRSFISGELLINNS